MNPSFNTFVKVLFKRQFYKNYKYALNVLLGLLQVIKCDLSHPKSTYLNPSNVIYVQIKLISHIGHPSKPKLYIRLLFTDTHRINYVKILNTHVILKKLKRRTTKNLC